MLPNGSDMLSVAKTCRLTALSVDSKVSVMADVARRRTALGENRSAALPLMWTALIERGWTDAHLAKEMNEDTAIVSRLLYGDRKANRKQGAKLLSLLGIPLNAWDEPTKVIRRKHADVRPAEPDAIVDAETKRAS